MIKISSWVFDNAFKQLQNWQLHLADDFQLSIKMSPFQLKIIEQKYDDWLNDSQIIPSQAKESSLK